MGDDINEAIRRKWSQPEGASLEMFADACRYAGALRLLVAVLRKRQMRRADGVVRDTDSDREYMQVAGLVQAIEDNLGLNDG